MLRDDRVGDAGGTPLPLRGRRLVVLAALGTLAQVTQGIIGLALVLVGHAAGFAVSTSAAAVAALTIGAGVARPAQGRALDRLPVGLVLGTCGALHFAAFGAIAYAANQRSTTGFIGAAIAAGVALPPISTRQRASWPTRVRPERAVGVYALVSSLQTISLLFAPVLFTTVAVAASSSVAMVVVAGVAGACTIAYAALDVDGSHRTRRARVAVHRYISPLIATCLLGIVVGGIEVVAPVLAIATHHATAAGPLVLIESVGTLVGALTATRLRRNLFAAGMAVQGVGCALLMIPAPLPVAGAELFLIGVGVTPALSTLSMVVSQRAGGTAESFGWQSTALSGGAASGSAIAGVLAHEIGSHASAAVSVAAAVLGLLLAARLTVHRAGAQ